MLDIIRAPLRNTASEVKSASEMLAGARRTPARVYLVIGCPTPREWQDHVAEAVTDCMIAVNSVNAVSESWSFLGLPGIPFLPAPAMLLADKLQALSKDLLAASILLDKDAGALSRAVDRVIKMERPVRKEGKGAKDAIILEHALGLTNALRASGFGQPSVFVSSNTNDFARSKTTALHPNLVPFFATPTDLRYAASITSAVAMLKKAGWVP